MRYVFLITGLVVFCSLIALAKSEDPTSNVVPQIAYGIASNGTIYPIKVDTDGTIYLH